MVNDGTASDKSYVTIGNPSGDGERFDWYNRGGESFSLAPAFAENLITGFKVGEDADKYGELFTKGFTSAALQYNEVGSLIRLIGPGDEEYNFVITFTPTEKQLADL